MDNRSRGGIEKAIDGLMGTKITYDIGWIEKEFPVKSMKDVALGYAVGAIMAMAVEEIAIRENRSSTDEDFNEVKTIIRRRLPELLDKINRELNQ